MRFIQIVFIFAYFAACGGLWADGKACRVQYDNPRLLGYLENKQINESSGICVSLVNTGIFWTHNDSGDSARMFAFDEKGRDVATIKLKNVRAVDFEDAASFTIDNFNYVMVCDTGTAAKQRDMFAIYIFREPQIDKNKFKQEKTVEPEFVIRFRYPDGGRDCEAAGFDTADRKIWLVSKTNTKKCRAYTLDWDVCKKDSGKTVTAEFMLELNLPTVTALDISPDSNRMIILTYMHAYEFVRQDGQGWDEALRDAKPRLIFMPPRAQGESICYGHDGKTLYLTSEKLPAPFWQVPVKQKHE